jgi:hypothetical protein
MAAPKPGDWMESLQNVADLGHFAAGYGVAVSCFPTHTWWRILIVEIVFLTLVGWKEFVYDLKNETGETVGSSTEDALGYVLGNVMGWVYIAFAHFYGGW